MSGFTPVIILILVMLIHALMRLSPNIFAIFCHSSIAKKSARRADRLSLYYALGTEIAIALLLVVTFFIVSLIFKNEANANLPFVWTLFGVLVLESIFSFFFYFKNRTTRLFLSRRGAKNLVKRAETAMARKDTFVLGFVTRIAELPFTFPLFILAAYIATKSSTIPCPLLTVCYLIVPTIPLAIIYILFHLGHNLAGFQRFQEKTKLITRLLITFGFITLAALTYAIGASI